MLIDRPEKVKMLNSQQVSKEIEQARSACFAIVYRVVRNKEDAEDTVQDAMLDCIKANKQFESVKHLRRYLFKTVYHASLNTIGRNKRYSRATEVCESTAVSTDRVDGWVDEIIDEGVVDIMSTLTPTLRHAVELRYIENLPYSEIGKIANITSDQARERVRTARRSMTATVSKIKSNK